MGPIQDWEEGRGVGMYTFVGSKSQTLQKLIGSGDGEAMSYSTGKGAMQKWALLPNWRSNKWLLG